LAIPRAVEPTTSTEVEMSPRKPEPKGKTQPEKLADELELDSETVKDLEPQQGATERIVGGRSTGPTPLGT
jgi:hypothetical protein